MTLLENDPREIGGYLLEGRLGAGGMGVVYRARSVSGRQVAVKVIRPELAADAEFRARFRQEVAAARKVSGAFTAPVLDADADAPAPWLVTLFIAGPSLGERVSGQGPLTPPEVRRLAAGLAEALREIHRAGLVHRDLKPGNVLLAEDGPRVIDFGIAKAAGETQLTSTGVAVGTPPFMAPEQFRSGTATAATDVFALGSVLAFAATGHGPFGADSSHAVGFRVVYEEPDLTGLAAELRPLVAACLAKDPEQRPTVERLLGLAAQGERHRTVRFRTGPVTPTAAAPAVAGPAAAGPVAPTPTAPAALLAAVAPPAPVIATPTVAPTATPATAPAEAAAPTGPVPPVVPSYMAAPSTRPSLADANTRPRRRKGVLIGSALSTVVVATAGTLGFLAWQDRAPDKPAHGQNPGPSSSVTATTAASACGPDGKQAVGADGLQVALVKQWQADYAKECPGAGITFNGPASGTVMDQYATFKSDGVALDSPMTADQRSVVGRHCPTGYASQIPVTVLPIAVVYNAPGLKGLEFDAPTLAKIFTGKITKWNDPAIKALNSIWNLPDTPIDVRIPSNESASTAIFTQYLAKAAPADFPYQPGRAWPDKSRPASGTNASDLPAYVAGAQWSMSFVPLPDAGALQKAKVRTGGSEAVELTPHSASMMAAGGSVQGTGTNLTVTIDYARPASGSYPIVDVGYIGFCDHGGADRAFAGTAVLTNFLAHGLSAPGQAAGENLMYGPLPDALTKRVLDSLAPLRVKPGSQ
ncbi:serine/threonine protein kinase [Streptomyces sp. 1114.5]|uniref:serine/threonine-protein kinase n=1 Tax=Streptomyces sp. 1114.5 TaxID=1938830 RepID=UPI000F2BB2FE|nr:serine/threonine-protein kinase [Streptomyces sp. 1114.5]RKT09810.1 serine/threonine protein kinase [Streptomyces sp. 1114.5]